MQLFRAKVLEIGEMSAGADYLLAKYLREKVNNFTYVEVLRSCYYRPGVNFLRVSHYKAGELKERSTLGAKWSFLFRWHKLQRLFLYLFILSFIITLPLRLRRKVDIFIGINSPYPLAGLILRKLGLVRKIISVSGDHLPSPKGINLFNRIYRYIDKLAQNSSNAVWYFSPRLVRVKKKEGFIQNNNIPRTVTSIGIDPEKAKIAPLEKVDRTSIGYIGKLDAEIGLDLAIEAIKEVAKVMPNVKLKIIGSGPSELKLKEKVCLLNLEDNVEFLGYINEREQIRDILSRCAICIAPYMPGIAYSIQFTDSAKLKEYMEYGTPIIVTKVPEIALEIERERAGYAVNYDKEEIAQAILRLLTDEKCWKECRENIKRLALKYDYRRIYDKAFLASGIKI